MRHAGRRRRGSVGCRRRWPTVRGAGRRPRDPRWSTALEGLWTTVARRAVLAEPRRLATLAVRLGATPDRVWTPPPTPTSSSTGRRSPSAPGAPTPPPAGCGPPWHRDRRRPERPRRGSRRRPRGARGRGSTTRSRRPRQFVVVLPGERKLRTTCSLIVGRPLAVDQRVRRAATPTRTTRRSTPGCSSATCGRTALVRHRPPRRRLPHRAPAAAAVTSAELDRVLGAVLEYADGSFNTILELGFRSAIQRSGPGAPRAGSPPPTSPPSPTSPTTSPA